MTLHMNDRLLVTVEEVETFLLGSEQVQFEIKNRIERYEWIAQTLQKFKYFTMRKKDKSTVKTFLCRITGFSDAQMTRLIKKKKCRGVIRVAKSKPTHRFPRVYTHEDIALLMETDRLHGRLSGPATKRIFVRMKEVYKDERYERLTNISVSHLYTLRGTRQYQSKLGSSFTKTRPTVSSIGERVKPNPEGKPGYLRIDTVHQGDKGKEKGVYHINIVDEVTQWETVGCVEAISEAFLLPLLEALINQFPFVIIEFHSDNGSEFINRQIAEMLNRLLIRQTKSRARRCNDNALIEGKNGSVIRKHMGRIHIAKKHAHAINNFYIHHFNPYVNYHRPSGFATIKINKRGKEKKVYDTYLMPYEKFLSLPSPEQYLKPHVTLEQITKLAREKTDNEAAQQMQEAKTKLFKTFHGN